MSKAAVIVSKRAGLRGYNVACGHHYDMARIFLWGQFDDCTITWQAARKQAMKYAEDWARSTGRRLVINL